MRADTKKCSRCGETKHVEEFHRSCRTPDGRRCWCKACRKEEGAIYYVKNKERIRLQGIANRDKRKKYAREHYRKNRDRILEKNGEWAEANRVRASEYKRLWANENREAVSASQSAYRVSNLDKYRAYAATRRALKREATVGDTTAIAAVYDLAQNGTRVRCYLCGELIPKGERHVDHVVPLSQGGPHAAPNLDIACAHCNLTKHNKLPDEIGMLPLEVAV